MPPKQPGITSSRPSAPPKPVHARRSPPASPQASKVKKPKFDIRNPSTIANESDNESKTSDRELQVTNAELDADQLSRRGPGTKRNAVNVDGFDSDSSTGEFEERARERERLKDDGVEGAGAGLPKSAMEEQEDMRADLEPADGDEDEDEGRAGTQAKKEVRFLEPTEIEGEDPRSKERKGVGVDLRAWVAKQHGFELPDTQTAKKSKRRREGAGTNDGSSTSSSSDEEGGGGGSERSFTEEMQKQNVDDEVGAGGLKTKAPQIEQFNTKNDRAEGAFDASGNFVRKAADADAAHDGWMEGIRGRDVRRAREAQRRREAEAAKSAEEEQRVTTAEALGRLVVVLEPSETTLGALERLGKKKERKAVSWQERRRMKKGAMQVDGEGTNGHRERELEEERRRKTLIEEITSAAGILERRGQADIYDVERELLMRQYQRETGEPWTAASGTAKKTNGGAIGDLADLEDSDDEAEEEEAEVDNLEKKEGRQWDYRWTDGRDGEKTHGPYGNGEMKAWYDAGYLGIGCEFRMRGSKDPWKHSADF